MCEKKSFFPFSIRYGGKLVEYDHTVVIGILNVTQDSFYDGGRYVTDEQIERRALSMSAEGADIIDIGVQSTRPGAMLMQQLEEAERLAHAVSVVRRCLPEAVISADTCFPLPAQAAVKAGANIINDISGGLFDDRMFDVVAEMQVPYILMHNRATPDRMQQCTSYDDILKEVALFFSQRLDVLHSKGVADVILDPGFGFAKTLDDNYELFARLSQLRALFPDTPLLVAISRKSMIYKLVGVDAESALPGTLALDALAVMAGAQMVRVHDVAEAVQSVRVVEKLKTKCISEI